MITKKRNAKSEGLQRINVLIFLYFQGEPMAHFPPVPLRSHELHYMHPHLYQQYFRSQQETRIPYHLPRYVINLNECFEVVTGCFFSSSPMLSGGLEKTKDGQEGEEAPVTSPPLELRRPGSVGSALTSRPVSVPHSLQSPHDRATGTISGTVSFAVF